MAQFFIGQRVRYDGQDPNVFTNGVDGIVLNADVDGYPYDHIVNVRFIDDEDIEQLVEASHLRPL